MKWFFGLLALLLAGISLKGQWVLQRGDRGLISNGITTMVFDSLTNNLWVGTQNGLQRFDGFSFVSYPDPKSPLKAFSLDDKFIKVLKIGNVPSQTQAAANKGERSLFIGTSKGLYIAKFINSNFDLANWDSLLINEDILDIAIVDQDSFFVLTKAKVYKCQFHRTSYGTPREQEQEDTGIQEEVTIKPTSIFGNYENFDRIYWDTDKNELWLTNDGIISIIDPINLRHKYRRLSEAVYTIWERGGGLYYGIANNPYSIETIDESIFDKLGSTKRATRSRYRQSLLNFVSTFGDPITCIYDTPISTWVGTYGQGLVEFPKILEPKAELISFDRLGNEVLDESIWAITPYTKDRFLVGTSKGTYVWDSITPQPIWTNWVQSTVRNIRRIGGTNSFLVGLANGTIYRCTFPGECERQDFSADWGRVYKITADSNSVFWIGTQSGLKKIKYDTGTSALKEESITQSPREVYDVYRYDTGSYLLATQDGVYKYNKGTFHQFINDSAKIAKERATTIYIQDRNAIWVGIHNRGLFKIDSAGEVMDTLLDERTIFGITKDEKVSNLIWVSTDRNIFQVKLYTTTPEALSFDGRFGFSQSEYNLHALIANDNKIFVGGNKGVEFFEPTTYAKNASLGIHATKDSFLIKGSYRDEKTIIDPKKDDSFEIFEGETRSFQFYPKHISQYPSIRFEYRFVSKEPSNWVLSEKNTVEVPYQKGALDIEWRAVDPFGKVQGEPGKISIVGRGSFWVRVAAIALVVLFVLLAIVIRLQGSINILNKELEDIEKQLEEKEEELKAKKKEVEEKEEELKAKKKEVEEKEEELKAKKKEVEEKEEELKAKKKEVEEKEEQFRFLEKISLSTFLIGNFEEVMSELWARLKEKFEGIGSLKFGLGIYKKDKAHDEVNELIYPFFIEQFEDDRSDHLQMGIDNIAYFDEKPIRSFGIQLHKKRLEYIYIPQKDKEEVKEEYGVEVGDILSPSECLVFLPLDSEVPKGRGKVRLGLVTLQSDKANVLGEKEIEILELIQPLLIVAIERYKYYNQFLSPLPIISFLDLLLNEAEKRLGVELNFHNQGEGGNIQAMAQQSFWFYPRLFFDFSVMDLMEAFGLKKAEAQEVVKKCIKVFKGGGDDDEEEEITEGERIALQPVTWLQHVVFNDLLRKFYHNKSLSLLGVLFVAISVLIGKRVTKETIREDILKGVIKDDLRRSFMVPDSLLEKSRYLRNPIFNIGGNKDKDKDKDKDKINYLLDVCKNLHIIFESAFFKKEDDSKLNLNQITLNNRDGLSFVVEFGEEGIDDGDEGGLKNKIKEKLEQKRRGKVDTRNSLSNAIIELQRLNGFYSDSYEDAGKSKDASWFWLGYPGEGRVEFSFSEPKNKSK